MEGSEPTSGQIDLDVYDLTGLREDLVELVDLQQLAIRTLQWTFLGPLAVGVVTWTYFSSRMPAWVVAPFTLVAVVLSLVGSVLAAVSIVMHRRLESATEASARVLDVLALAHADLDRVADGTANVSIKEVASEVLETAVFPGLIDGVTQTVPFPLRFLARPLVWLPTKVVERTVMAVVDRLPVETLGRLSAEDAAAAGEEAGKLRAAYDSLPEELEKARNTLTTTVRWAVASTTKPLVVLVVVSLLPLLGWLLVGDALA